MSVNLEKLSFSQVKGRLFFSYFIALIFDAMVNIGLIPFLMPSLTLLMLFYWVLQLQDRSHLTTALVLGILMDAIMETTLGSHALLITFLVFLLLNARHRFQGYPIWQQSVILVLYFTAYQILGFFLLTPILTEQNQLQYWLSPLQIILLWPFISILLNRFNNQLPIRQ